MKGFSASDIKNNRNVNINCEREKQKVGNFSLSHLLISQFPSVLHYILMCI